MLQALASPFGKRVSLALLACSIASRALSQTVIDPERLLGEAERLAWLKAWTRAAPLYADAEKLFEARGDRRNALYAQINRLRGELPHLPAPEVSQRLGEYLDDPLVRTDDRLRLRSLVIKGETDTDLDPFLAEQSWREALTIAERLGDQPWANRARGELGLVAFLEGNVGAAIVQLGQALKVAESNGDVASVVRWLTLFGHGYVQLGRPAEALDYYDRAIKLAGTVPELQLPLMTYEGKGEALVRLGRPAEAEQMLGQAMEVAEKGEAWGYRAELTLKLALIAKQKKDVDRLATLLTQATEFARRAGGNRILAEIALERGQLLREKRALSEAADVLEEGVDVARKMQDHLLLPRLLTEEAEVRAAQRRLVDAANLLTDASDVFEGFLTSASSPWVQGRIINAAKDVFLARIRLEGARGPDAGRLLSILEQARGRALLEQLIAAPIADVRAPAGLRAGERRIAELQLQLFQAQKPPERERLLDQIFLAEEQLAPLETALFDRTRRTTGRKPLTLIDLQHALRNNELFIEFAVAEPRSYAVIVSRSAARVQPLAGRAAIESKLKALVDAIRAEQPTGEQARGLAVMLIDPVRELATFKRVIISPDGGLHQLPFELLADTGGHRILETHVVSYVPSGSVLTVLRERTADRPPSRTVLAVSASPDAPAISTSGTNGSIVTRSVYDLDLAHLRPLPAANDEARAVGTLIGESDSTVLVGAAATESAVKRQPLQDFRVLHFAVHGVPSTRYPARSALVLQPADGEDGLFQAREILGLRLRAALVTLSACETGTGMIEEQEGVASLVRPFLAVGAHSVVANLWAADDQFSLSLMREFYRQLASGHDIGDALRLAKMRMLELYGASVAPKFWSGLLAYGDSSATIVNGQRTKS